MDRSQSTTNVVVGIDIGRSKIAFMVSDVESGDELARLRLETPVDSHPRVIVNLIVDKIRKLTQDSKRGLEVVKAVSVAIPGQVDELEGRVMLAGNLSAWIVVPLPAWLESCLDVPVWIEQDANAAALGERWWGAARSMNNFVFLALGTGVGAGIVINGRLHRGYRHAAGEVGNFVIDQRYLGKAKGAHENLEQLIGGPHFERGSERQLGTIQVLKKRLLLRTTTIQWKPKSMPCKTIWHSMSALLDPPTVIFGGGTSAAGSDLIDPVRDCVDRELRTRPALILSALSEDAQLGGAVFGGLWALDPSLALWDYLR